MPADGYPDLAQLTLAACRAQLASEFVRANETGPDVVLSLVSAEEGRRDPTASEGGDRPFILVFRGPDDQVLTQGMHDLDHARLPLRGVFLTRIRGEGAGAWYEAVFS